MTDSDRLTQLLTYFKLSPAKFASTLGFKRPDRIYHVLKNRNGISEELGKIITNVYNNISYEWLVFDIGEMIKKDVKPEELIKYQQEQALNFAHSIINESNEVLKISPLIMYVPLVHHYAYTGYFNGFSNPEYIETLPKIPFMIEHNGKGNYISFEVKGDSMYDGTENSYIEGDRILCREISPEYWKKLHISKWDFVIIHKTDGILIKKILTHDVDNGKITVHSLNPEYEDKELNLSKVYKLFKIIELQRVKK